MATSVNDWRVYEIGFWPPSFRKRIE